MSVTAYKTPGTAASVDRDGKPVWYTPENAKVSNNSYAGCLCGKADYSDWLRVTNFGFTTGDIPSGATIDGIDVKIERKAVAADKFNDSALYLRKTAGQVGDNKASAAYWATSDEEVVYGGAADTWNSNLVDTDIRSSDFGVDLSAYNNDSSVQWYAYIDCIWIRVYYTGGAIDPPTVTTQPVSDITPTTATGNGNITDTGGETPSAWGVCVSTTENPDTGDDVFAGSGAGGIGAFTAAMIGLAPGTKYYVRAYATNSAGTSYGADVTFRASYDETGKTQVILATVGETEATTRVETGKLQTILASQGVPSQVVTRSEVARMQTILASQGVPSQILTMGELEKLQAILVAQGKSDLATFTEKEKEQVILATLTGDAYVHYSDLAKEQIVLAVLAKVEQLIKVETAKEQVIKTIISPSKLLDWNKRIQLTIDHNDIDGVLTDFPILVHLSTSSGRNNTDASCVFDELTSDANRKKIAVTTSDGVTQCYVEIEDWDDANEKAWLWIKAPSVASGANTVLYLYYDSSHADNTDYVGDTGSAPAENVWDEHFKAVYHMNDGADNAHIYDSTSNHNHGTKKAANEPNEVDGLVGKAQDFDGINDNITLPASSTLLPSSPGTIEAIATSEADYPALATICNLHRGAAAGSGFTLRIEDDRWKAYARDGVSGDYLSSGIAVDTNIHYLVTTNDSTTHRIFVDGIDRANRAQDFVTGTYAGHIGNYDDSQASSFWKGTINETRISDIDRAAAWIKATKESLWDVLLAFGSEEIGIQIYGEPPQIQTMNELGKLQTTLVVIDGNAYQNFEESAKEQVILGILAKGEQLIKVEIGKEQIILATLAQTDLATFSEKEKSQVLLAVIAGNAFMRCTETERQQIILAVLAKGEQLIKGEVGREQIILTEISEIEQLTQSEVGREQIVLGVVEESDMQSMLETAHLQIVLSVISEGDAATWLETGKEQIILVVQEAVDTTLFSEIGKTQTILTIITESDAFFKYLAALKYILELHNSDGDLIAILENAHDIAFSQAINSPYMLNFALPADDSKVSNILLANEIWLRNYKTGEIIKKFRLSTKRDIRA